METTNRASQRFYISFHYVCLDCTNTIGGYEYQGQTNITATGKPCQRWDQQNPHGHGYTDPSTYPDPSIKEAENYCRNPDLGWAAGTWCYTMDENTRWEHCKIPICGIKMCL